MPELKSSALDFLGGMETKTFLNSQGMWRPEEAHIPIEGLLGGEYTVMGRKRRLSQPASENEAPHFKKVQAPQSISQPLPTNVDAIARISVVPVDNYASDKSISEDENNKNVMCTRRGTRIGSLEPDGEGIPSAGRGTNQKYPSKSSKAVPTGASGTFSSLYRGVTRHRLTGRWEAHFWDANHIRPKVGKSGRTRGRQVYLGGYVNEDEASRAYDRAALCYLGPNAPLNHPLEDYAHYLEDLQRMTPEEVVANLRRGSVGFARGSSQYRGVTKHHLQGKWEARIGRINGQKYIYLGTYDSAEEAAKAYDRAAVKFKGTKAITNFGIHEYQDILDDPDGYTIDTDRTLKQSLLLPVSAPRSRGRRGQLNGDAGGQVNMEESYTKITGMDTMAAAAAAAAASMLPMPWAFPPANSQQPPINIPVQFDASGNLVFAGSPGKQVMMPGWGNWPWYDQLTGWVGAPVVALPEQPPQHSLSPIKTTKKQEDLRLEIQGMLGSPNANNTSIFTPSGKTQGGEGPSANLPPAPSWRESPLGRLISDAELARLFRDSSRDESTLPQPSSARFARTTSQQNGEYSNALSWLESLDLAKLNAFTMQNGLGVGPEAHP